MASSYEDFVVCDRVLEDGCPCVQIGTKAGVRVVHDGESRRRTVRRVLNSADLSGKFTAERVVPPVYSTQLCSGRSVF